MGKENLNTVFGRGLASEESWENGKARETSTFVCTASVTANNGDEQRRWRLVFDCHRRPKKKKRWKIRGTVKKFVQKNSFPISPPKIQLYSLHFTSPFHFLCTNLSCTKTFSAHLTKTVFSDFSSEYFFLSSSSRYLINLTRENLSRFFASKNVWQWKRQMMVGAWLQKYQEIGLLSLLDCYEHLERVVGK